MSSRIQLVLCWITFTWSAVALGQTPTIFDGDQFQVNTYTSGKQRDPALAVDADGDFVVVWASPFIPFFADDFESGDTSEWIVP